MTHDKRPEAVPDYDAHDGLALALSYLEDPSAVECPHCGPDRIEVLGYYDADSIPDGSLRMLPPDDDYAVVMYCHGCRRGAALELNRTARSERPATD